MPSNKNTKRIKNAWTEDDIESALAVVNWSTWSMRERESKRERETRERDERERREREGRKLREKGIASSKNEFPNKFFWAEKFTIFSLTLI